MAFNSHLLFNIPFIKAPPEDFACSIAGRASLMLSVPAMTLFRSLLLLSLLVLAQFGYTEELLPAGTALPIMLGGSLNSARLKPGGVIRAMLMQDVFLPSGGRIRHGAKIEGSVVEATAASLSSPARLVLRFYRLTSDDKQYALSASLLSLASMADVFDAQLPVGTFDEYGTSVSDWTTVQVGGAAVYLGDQTVRDGMQIVGEAPGYGMTRAKLVANPKRGCPAIQTENQQAQSLWVFSPWACGIYGFENLAITHHGNTAPVGIIELNAPKVVRIPGGCGLLLRVLPVGAVGSHASP